jgi:hypothetical protein
LEKLNQVIEGYLPPLGEGLAALGDIARYIFQLPLSGLHEPKNERYVIKFIVKVLMNFNHKSHKSGRSRQPDTNKDVAGFYIEVFAH